jgi:hypothetical protein
MAAMLCQSCCMPASSVALDGCICSKASYELSGTDVQLHSDGLFDVPTAAVYRTGCAVSWV